MRRRRLAGAVRRALAGLLAGGLLAGCAPSEQQLREQRLRDAVRATVAEPFGFDLALDVDERAFADLEDAAGPLASLLASVEVDGVVDGDRLAMDVVLLDLDAFELRVVDRDGLLVRSDLAGLVELLGRPAAVEAEVAGRLRAAGTRPAVVDAVTAVVRGEWVRLETGADGGDGPGAGRGAAAALRGLLESAEVTDHIGRLEGDDPFDGQLTVEVDVVAARRAVRALLAGLEPATETPEDDATAAPGARVRGRVLVTAGRVRQVSLDLGSALAQAAGRTGGGDLTVLLDLAPTPRDAVDVPTPTVTLADGDLQEVLAAIGAALAPAAGDARDGGDGGSGDGP